MISFWAAAALSAAAISRTLHFHAPRVTSMPATRHLQASFKS
ncbi:MAG: hypothetical protein ACKO1F_04495 [Flammeovirgaceae bacterium]